MDGDKLSHFAPLGPTTDPSKDRQWDWTEAAIIDHAMTTTTGMAENDNQAR
jgi:hypothetical protein